MFYGMQIKTKIFGETYFAEYFAGNHDTKHICLSTLFYFGCKTETRCHWLAVQITLNFFSRLKLITRFFSWWIHSLVRIPFYIIPSSPLRFFMSWSEMILWSRICITFSISASMSVRPQNPFINRYGVAFPSKVRKNTVLCCFWR